MWERLKRLWSMREEESRENFIMFLIEEGEIKTKLILRGRKKVFFFFLLIFSYVVCRRNEMSQN